MKMAQVQAKGSLRWTREQFEKMKDAEEALPMERHTPQETIALFLSLCRAVQPLCKGAEDELQMERADHLAELQRRLGRLRGVGHEFA
jgi:hypothetical protein